MGPDFVGLSVPASTIGTMPSTTSLLDATAGLSTVVRLAQQMNDVTTELAASKLGRHLAMSEQLGPGYNLTSILGKNHLATAKALERVHLGSVAAQADFAPTLAKLAALGKDFQGGPLAKAARMMGEQQAIYDDLFAAGMRRRRAVAGPSSGPRVEATPTALASPVPTRVLPPPLVGQVPVFPVPSFPTFIKVFGLVVGAPFGVFVGVLECVGPYFDDPTDARAAAGAITVLLALMVWSALFAAGTE